VPIAVHNDDEETKDGHDEPIWIEVRLQGKLPERRSNHCAFIFKKGSDEYLYIHGGRDLKEGSIATMWKVNINSVKELSHNSSLPVEWELVTTAGRNPGKISHHKVFVVNAQNVLMYGG